MTRSSARQWALVPPSVAAFGVLGVIAAAPPAAAAPPLPYGPDTCIQGFVWRDAFGGDQACVVPAVRDQAAADNAAAASRRQASAPEPAPPPPPPPPPPPKQGPAVSWDPRIGGLTAHVTDRSGVASQCVYDSDGYHRSFFLAAKATYDLVIVPAIPKFSNWNVSITCDNGTSTNTSTFF